MIPTRRLSLLALVAVALVSPVRVHAQNPCAAPPPALSTNPTQVFVTLPEHAATIPGVTPAQQKVTNYLVAYFAEGANPATATPVAGPVTMPKATFTLVVGTTDCYRIPLPLPVPPPPGTRSIGAFRAHRDAFTVGTDQFAAEDSPWSVVSNPFVQVSTALAAPGQPIFRQ